MRLNTIGTGFVVVCAFSLSARPADAGLSHWLTEVNTGTVNVFVDTNITSPTTRNIGALSGDRTYEFIVNASAMPGQSATLIGVRGAAPEQAIKFDQFFNTGMYGLTFFTVADLTFPGTLTNFDQDVHLAFVMSGGTTSFFENGQFVSSIGAVLDLQSLVGVGQNFPAISNPLDGTILGIATYDSAMSAAEVLVHANAFFGPVPEPSTALLAVIGAAGFGLRRRSRA